MMVSSAGRAPDYHSGCHGFDSRTNTSVKTDSSSDDAQASRSTLKPKGGRRLMESVLAVLMADGTTAGTALQGADSAVPLARQRCVDETAEEFVSACTRK